MGPASLESRPRPQPPTRLGQSPGQEPPPDQESPPGRQSAPLQQSTRVQQSMLAQRPAPARWSTTAQLPQAQLPQAQMSAAVQMPQD